MPSAALRRFVYDHSEQQLWVEFVNGRRFVYCDVPPSVADALGSAFAREDYFNSRIRDRFPHRESQHEDQATES